jgi:hypothetical protein
MRKLESTDKLSGNVGHTVCEASIEREITTVKQRLHDIPMNASL